MSDERLVKMLENAGFYEQAARIAGVTPEKEAAFDEWLEDPANRARWDAALKAARP